ncbi:hypothetical protein ACIBBD_07520 [Streptomyces sp. NPDC051315]|uniref:hypothetical protein n=1 Tax=Streptomyces sp. NPDC051315 TaxID=3365650 RepID=UPI00378F6923
METRAQSPQPPGVPRWAAMFYEASSGTWRLGAESPDRSPVVYAIGEMAQVMRARGDEVTVALWGPQDGAWRRFDTAAPTTDTAVATADTAVARADTAVAPDTSSRSASGSASGSTSGSASQGAGEPSRLAERMHDRRHQVLMAGLSRAGLYDLAPDDVAAVRTVVDRLDEATLRRVAHWMAVAGHRAG